MNWRGVRAPLALMKRLGGHSRPCKPKAPRLIEALNVKAVVEVTGDGLRMQILNADANELAVRYQRLQTQQIPYKLSA